MGLNRGKLSQSFEVFWVFLRLGCTSFGGPVAHLGYFHDEFVKRRKWVEESVYADLVALCQFLPGPASSQVGMALGLSRAGLLGSIAAWVGFTLPSALILILAAFGIAKFAVGEQWLHGFKVVAVAVVAQALWGMAVKLCPDRERASIAVVAGVVAALGPSAGTQIAVIIGAGVIGAWWLKQIGQLPHSPFSTSISKRVGLLFLSTFALLLLILPLVAGVTHHPVLEYCDRFFRAGALVFGGGHVVLPLLQAEVVPAGWISNESFMAGYGMAQAIPGPLFAFSAYVGAASQVSPSGWVGALVCLVAAFLPSYLLVVGILPFWERVRGRELLRAAMLGVNASVVGLLLSAFYNPVWVSAINTPKDFSLAVVCFFLLVFWSVPSWIVVIFGTLISGFLGSH